MKNDFDFKQSGKRMPYKTPEGFLDEIESNVWRAVESELVPTRKKTRRNIRGSIAYGIAAVCLVLLVGFGVNLSQKTRDFRKLEQAFDNLATSDQDYLLAVYQYDFFLNE